MIKVAMISTGITGGAGVAAFRLHRQLLKVADVESTFIQRFHQDEGFAKANNIYTAPTGHSLLIRARKKYNLHTEHFNWKRFEKYPKNYEIATYPTTSYRLEELPIVKQADIIHLHWIAEFLNYPTFFRKVKQPIVWTLHDMNPFQGIFHYEGDKNENNTIFKKIDKTAYDLKIKAIHKKNNINIVTPSGWLKDISLSSEMFRSYPHFVIPNGLDLNLYPKIDRAKAKEETGVANGKKTIVFVAHGIGIYRKGFDILLDAINKLNEFQFNLISVGGDKIEAGSKINHIHYNRIDDTKELNKIYSAADITILPSREDNLPNVMLESMANGTPVISFGHGGMAEHIKTGMNGILVDKINPLDLSLAIKDFLEDKYSFDPDRINDYAEKHFSDILQTERYTDLYKRILI